MRFISCMSSSCHLRWVLVLISMAGCGDALVDGAYSGEPLFEIEGRILQGRTTTTRQHADSRIRIAVAWIGDVDRESEVQQTLAQSSLPARYGLRLFREPSARSWRSDVFDGALASIGQILLYDDQAGDGRWDRFQDPIVGGGLDDWLLYLPEAADVEVLGGTLEAGWYVVRAGYCGGGATGDRTAVQGLGDPAAVDLRITEIDDWLAPDLNCSGLPSDRCLELLANYQRAESEAERERSRRVYAESCQHAEDAPAELGQADVPPQSMPSMSEMVPDAGVGEPDASPCATYREGILEAESEAERERWQRFYDGCVAEQREEQSSDPDRSR